MTTWNYRLVRYRNGNFGIHEVYYGDDGQATTMTSDPCGFEGDKEDGPEGLVEMLRTALRDATERPIFDEPEAWPERK